MVGSDFERKKWDYDCRLDEAEAAELEVQLDLEHKKRGQGYRLAEVAAAELQVQAQAEPLGQEQFDIRLMLAMHLV